MGRGCRAGYVWSMEYPRQEKEGKTPECMDEHRVRGKRGRSSSEAPLKAITEGKTQEPMEEEHRVRGKRGRSSIGTPIKARDRGKDPRTHGRGAQ